MEKWKLVNVTNLKGETRTDGRYPDRIGRLCKRPYGVVGTCMFIEWLTDNKGNSYEGYVLQTSLVNGVIEKPDGNSIVVSTCNSVYYFEKQ